MNASAQYIAEQARTFRSPSNSNAHSAQRRRHSPAVPKMRAENVNFFYGAFQALHDISLDFCANKVTALIGPSGCGKSTFLRNLNRINETLRDTRLEGEITLDGENILEQDVTEIRRRIGMVFQRPNPFPKSIFDNIVYGPKINGMLKAAATPQKSWKRACAAPPSGKR